MQLPGAGARKLGERALQVGSLPSSAATIDWSLPAQWGKRWTTLLDTTSAERAGQAFDSGQAIQVGGRSLAVFVRSAVSA